MSWELYAGRGRLAAVSVPAKVMLTAFLLLVGPGYLVAVFNIYGHHQDADLELGLTLDDLRRVYHGLDKEVTAETRTMLPSPMQEMVRPGGPMRKNLERGGEPAVRALIWWLENGAREADFAREGACGLGYPSAERVIAEQCVRCHRADGGEAAEVPYAPDAETPPKFELVSVKSSPVIGPASTQSSVMHLAPMDRAELVHITHAHILSMPVFALVVGGLFLGTGLSSRVKLVLGPLPLAAMFVDLASWWLARPFEPFVFVIAGAGAVFGVAYGVQIVCVVCSLWFGRREAGG